MTYTSEFGSDILGSLLSSVTREQLRPSVDSAQHRSCGGLPQTAERSIGHSPSHVGQPLYITGLVIAFGQLCENLVLALRSELAWVALPTRLVREEVCQPAQHLAHVARLIEDHDHSRAKWEAGLFEILKGHLHIQMLCCCKSPRRPSEQDPFQLSANNASAEIFE